MRLLSVPVLVLALLLAPGGASSAAPPPTRVPGVLVVGLHPPAPRFQSGAVDGARIAAPRGLEVDLARAIARELGTAIEFRYVPHQAGFLSAGPKPWDIGLDRIGEGASDTRPTLVPYLRAPLGVLLRRGLEPPVTSARDLRFLRLCVRAGSAGARLAARSLRPLAPPVLLASRSAELRRLAAGDCDAAVDDAVALAAARAQAPGRYGRLAGAPAGGATRYAIALPGGSPLRPALRGALRTLGADGVLAHLARTWLGVDPARLPRLRGGGGPTTVTLIGDSVSASIGFVPGAREVLASGLHLRFEGVSCRRLAAPSCGHPPPPTALETIRADGRSLGDVVVMDIGYNDSASAYAEELDSAMRSMLADGVRRVVWVTLRERYANYHSTNEVIRAAARRWPELSVADWNAYSLGRPWFVSDGIHLNAAGALALARFLRGYLG